MISIKKCQNDCSPRELMSSTFITTANCNDSVNEVISGIVPRTTDVIRMAWKRYSGYDFDSQWFYALILPSIGQMLSKYSQHVDYTFHPSW